MCTHVYPHKDTHLKHLHTDMRAPHTHMLINEKWHRHYCTSYSYTRNKYILYIIYMYIHISIHMHTRK